MASAQADVAARLIEQLLVDPAFRARFRRDPAGACREAGLDELADEMSIGAGKAMYTLDVRESKSSLAGVMMAAAMEGVGIYEFSENVLPHLEEIPGHVADVLSRVDLPAIKLPNFGGAGGGGGGGGGAAAAAAVPAPSGDGLVSGADAAGGGGGGAAAAAPPVVPVAPVVAPETSKEVAADAAAKAGKGADKAAAVPAAPSPAEEAAKKIAAESSPEAAKQAAVDKAAADLDAQGSLPSADQLPSAPVADAPPAGAAPAADAAAAAPPPGASQLPTAALADAASADLPTAPPPADNALPTAPAPGVDVSDAAAAPVKAAAEAVAPDPKYVPDPAMYGMNGTGGPPSPEALAVLKDDNIILDANGKQDFQSGRMDPRMAAILLKLAEKHKITVSCTESDHPVDTVGGSVSNHNLGRGFDIAAIDGQTVNSDNPVARDIAGELAELDPSIRPTEVGTPWPISEPGYFSDADHQDHIHVAFDDPITKDWQPPAGLLAGDAPAPAAEAVAVPPAPVAAAAPVAAPVAAPAPAAAGAAVEPPKPRQGSEAFLKAVTAQEASSHKKGASQAFLKAVEPPKAAAASAPPAAAAADAPPGAPAAALAADLSGAPTTYPGDNASQDQIAAWMAAEAQKRGLPPQLPVMASLVESGMKNLNFGDADSVGFFQMRVGTWNQGDYAGFPDKPELQLKWFLDTAEAVKKQRVAAGQSIDDPKQFGNWIADVERPAEQYRGRYQLKLDQANGLLSQHAAAPAAVAAAAPSAPAAAAVDAAAPAAPAAADGSLGAAALRIAETQRGVREIGSTNTGPQVDHFLAAAGVAPGNPWCASFVTWSLEQAGHKMPGGGWAAVSTWVNNAKQGNNGLQIVSAADARPGDIVAYDWGGQDDFGADGHIGFLASGVKDGQFNALEGNNGDAVNLVPRHLGSANIVFIRAAGDAPAGAAPAAVASAASAAPGAPAAAAAAAAPGAPAAAAADGPPPPPKRASQGFLRAVTAEAAAKDRAKRSESMGFLKAVEPPKAAAASAPPAAAPAAPAPAVAEAAAAAFGGPAGAVPPYPGDNAPQEQIAAWMAAQAQARGLPPQLPIMASLVESGMKNLNFGDADSVGFFQMRVGIWNQGDYAGFPDKPELQVKWFLDQAEAVKKQRIAAGKSVDDPNQFGDWIADVERPAEQYRGRYQLKLAEAQDLLKTAPAPAAAPVAAAVDPGAAAASAAAVADGGLPPEVAKPLADAIAAGAAPGPQALKAVEEASKYIGTQYHWGGSTPQTGFDCSGLMQWAYAQAGISTPRVTYDQIDAANAIAVPSVDDLKPGDLVFFSNAGDVHHVGMYLGDHQFLHAPHTGDVVKVSSLDEPYYKQQFAGGRRFDQGAAVAAAPPAAAPVAVAAAAPAAPLPAAPAPDPTAVATAQAHVARDAAEVRRNDSHLFMAVTAEEARKNKHASVMFLKAVKPEQVTPQPPPVAAAAAVPPPPAPPVEPVPAAPVEPAPAAPVEPAPAAPADSADLSASASVDLTDAASAYPGNDATQAELAKWLAGQAQKAGLPPELPVMASLVESGVKNLNFGDADSVGFFQMRVGIWNKGAYAGFPEKPELQAKWFIDQALAVKRQAIASGDANFGKDPSKFGEWIANVERPAEQFRGRYQLRLGEARKLLS